MFFKKGVIIFSHDRILSFTDLEGYDILRRPLPFSEHADATFENSTPLSLGEIRLSEKVWVEPIGGASADNSQPAPSGDAPDDSFMNIPDGIDDELPFA